jgi:hypothetical protein
MNRDGDSLLGLYRGYEVVASTARFAAEDAMKAEEAAEWYRQQSGDEARPATAEDIAEGLRGYLAFEVGTWK